MTTTITHLADDQDQEQLSKLNQNLDVLKEVPGTELATYQVGVTPSFSGAATKGVYGGDIDNLSTADYEEYKIVYLYWASALGTQPTVNHESGGAGQIHLAGMEDIPPTELGKVLQVDKPLILQRIGTDWYEIILTDIPYDGGVSYANFGTLKARTAFFLGDAFGASNSPACIMQSTDTDGMTISTNPLATDSDIHFEAGGGEQFRIESVSSPSTYAYASGLATNRAVFGVSSSSESNVSMNLYTHGTGVFDFWSQDGANKLFRVGNINNAVNSLIVYPATTGNEPVIQSIGSDSSVGMKFRVKSDGPTIFQNDTFATQLVIQHQLSAVNYLNIKGGTTGNPAEIYADGSDADVDLLLKPKGAGDLRFGTHSAIGAETITGYIEIKDAGGTLRKLAVVS